MARPTIADVARAARVGVATVDRVLNGRAAVKPETAARVLEAAQSVGYHATALLRRRLAATLPVHRLGFLLQRPEQIFYQGLHAAIVAACAEPHDFRAVCTVRYLPSQAATDISDGLRRLALECDAVAMVAVDHPAVAATVAEISGGGVPVFTLLSDSAPAARRAYIGLDNFKVGRTAGWLLARLMGGRGKVAIFVGSHRFHGHEMREIGCRSTMREYAAGFDFVDTQTSLEDVAIAREAVLDLLKRHPDLGGLYLAGGGTEGAIAALREEGASGRIAFVGNENTDITRPALADGTISAVIATPVREVARAAVTAMRTALADPNSPATPPVFLDFHIHTPENL